MFQRIVGVLKRIPFCIKTHNKIKNVRLLGKVHLKNKNVVCEGKVTLCDGVKILGNGRVVFGNNTFIADNTIIFSTKEGEEIVFGDDVMVAANCYFVNATHNAAVCDIPMIKQGVSGAPIKICNDVWICEGVTVLHGVTIGGGCIIGAKSLVKHTCDENSVYVGIPCKKIKNR